MDIVQICKPWFSAISEERGRKTATLFKIRVLITRATPWSEQPTVGFRVSVFTPKKLNAYRARRKETVHMINWDDLKYCLALDRHGSMVNAAKSVRANVATVSRRIEHITNDIGETLFIRHGQEWKTTGVGVELVELATEIEARLNALELVHNEPLSDQSVIRLSVSLTIMQTFMKNFSAYRAEQNQLFNVDLTIHDRSLAYSETDVAVRYTRPEQGNYICAKIGGVEIGPYISATSEAFPKDWLEIDYDGLNFHPKNFGFTMPDIPKLRIEGLNLAAQSLTEGNFLGFFPTKFADQIPALRRADNVGKTERLDIWMVYHQTRKLDPLVRAAVEIIMGSFHTNSCKELTA